MGVPEKFLLKPSSISGSTTVGARVFSAPSVVKMFPPPSGLNAAAISPTASMDRLPMSLPPFSASSARTRPVLGIEDLHLHDLRHEGVSRLFEQGLDIPRVAMISGHQSWATLRRYTHLKPKDVVDRLTVKKTATQESGL